MDYANNDSVIDGFNLVGVAGGWCATHPSFGISSGVYACPWWALWMAAYTARRCAEIGMRND